jgi:hypothetical protein
MVEMTFLSLVWILNDVVIGFISSKAYEKRGRSADTSHVTHNEDRQTPEIVHD